MTRVGAGWTTLLALGLVIACAKDSPSGGEIAAPGVAGGPVAAGASDPRGKSEVFSGDGHVAMRDDCDPRDPGWAPTGGCHLREGSVTLAEFISENLSPLAAAVVGHQAWRNDPSYLKLYEGTTIRVRNDGGRGHTFTKVQRFGGGRVPAPFLTLGLTPAPECLRPDAVEIPPGERATISGLEPGNHRFQCCIHPWMRTLVKVNGN